MTNNEIMCAYDKDRVCDETCAAFRKDEIQIDSEPYFDTSDPIPQFKWKSSIRFKADVCRRLQRSVGNREILERK